MEEEGGEGGGRFCEWVVKRVKKGNFEEKKFASGLSKG